MAPFPGTSLHATLRAARCLLAVLSAGTCGLLAVSEVERASEMTVTENSLEITLLSEPTDYSLKIARHYNPVRQVVLQTDDGDADLTLVPEPHSWEISLPKQPNLKGSTVLIETEGRPRLAGKPVLIRPDDHDTLKLHAHLADTFGEKLRYEPQPHKNTLGYWTVETDFATWNVHPDKPGTYEVYILQGCGQGQGGSQARITLGDQELNFSVEDTGHFQNFKRRRLGQLKIPSAETQTLRLSALKKAKKAVMDVRLIELIPVN